MQHGEGPFDLAVIEIPAQAPSVNGLVADLQRHQPGLPVIFTRAGAGPDRLESVPGPVLPRPFTLEALERCVRELLTTGTCADCHSPVQIGRRRRGTGPSFL